MRLNLNPLLLAASASVASATDVIDTEWDRKLITYPTTPYPLEIEYDGSMAQCDPGTGRRAHSEPYTDVDCPDGGFKHDYQVIDGGLRNYTVHTCTKSDGFHVLKFTGGPPPDPTSGDCMFLNNLAESLLSTNNGKDKKTNEARTAKAALALCQWPSGLPVEFTLDAQEEQDAQRKALIIYDPSIILVPDAYAYDALYNSLCSNIDLNKHLVSIGGEMTVTLNQDPPCANPSLGEQASMFIGGGFGAETCQAPSPHSSDPAGINVANGNCFGRCGAGCGTATQYTVDCADYDYCARFGIARWGDTNCHEEWLHQLDDFVFSGNCIDGKEQQREICELAPTMPPASAPPTKAPVAATASPTSSPTIKPTNEVLAIVLTKSDPGGNCNDVCNYEVPGRFTGACTEARLKSENNRFTELNMAEEIDSMNIFCISTSAPTSSVFAPGATIVTDGDPELGNAICHPAEEPKDPENFDCAANAPPGQVRLCSCTQFRM